MQILCRDAAYHRPRPGNQEGARGFGPALSLQGQASSPPAKPAPAGSIGRATCGVAVGQIDSKMPQTGTPELVYCRRALVDTLKPHCCWGPNGVSVWVWQGGASRIGRELAGGQPLSLSSKSCR